MATRWVLHESEAERVDGSEVLRDIAQDVAKVAESLAPVRSGRTRQSVHVETVTPTYAIVQANPRNPDPDTKPDDKDYAAYVERGTSDTPAQPFLRPALFRYRS